MLEHEYSKVENVNVNIDLHRIGLSEEILENEEWREGIDRLCDSILFELVDNVIGMNVNKFFPNKEDDYDLIITDASTNNVEITAIPKN